MLKGIKEFISRSDAITVAGGLLMALAAFTLIQAAVGYLIAPLIAVVVGEPIFALNSFTIDGSEFRYGAVIEAAITFALVSAAVYFLLVVLHRGRQGEDGGTGRRACPECMSSISVAAKRCPHCTAMVPLAPSGGV